jgi:prolyl 4-hydroxylase
MVELKERYEIGEVVAKDPLVTVVDDFVTEAEQSHIVKLAKRGLGAAKVSTIGENAYSEKRTGSVAWVRHDQTPIVRNLVRRVSEIVGIPVGHAESLQVIHYGVTEEYKAHFDAYDITTEKGRLRTAKGGQRLVTALMYLNEVEAGGGTGFPKLKLEVEPVPGRMVLFHNIGDKGTNRHKKSLHGGLPVIAGEKWACNLWFREHAYQATPSGGGVPGRPGRSRSDNKKHRKSQKAARRRNR